MSVDMTEPVGRRNFAQGLALGNMAWAAGEDTASPTWFDVRRFGARGDGKASCLLNITGAIGATIDGLRKRTRFGSSAARSPASAAPASC